MNSCLCEIWSCLYGQHAITDLNIFQRNSRQSKERSAEMSCYYTSHKKNPPQIFIFGNIFMLALCPCFYPGSLLFMAKTGKLHFFVIPPLSQDELLLLRTRSLHHNSCRCSKHLKISIFLNKRAIVPQCQPQKDKASLPTLTLALYKCFSQGSQLRALILLSFICPRRQRSHIF